MSSRPAYLDSVPFLVFITQGLLMRSDLLQLLESTYNMTLLERSHSLSLQRLGPTHLYDIITVDEGTAILLQGLAELEQDRACERVVMRLSALSLQFTHCWVLLHCTDQHDSLVCGEVFSNLVLIYSAFVVFGLKSEDLDVKVFLMCDIEDIAQYVHQICQHTLLNSKRDVQSWFNRDWFSVLPTETIILILTPIFLPGLWKGMSLVQPQLLPTHTLPRCSHTAPGTAPGLPSPRTLGAAAGLGWTVETLWVNQGLPQPHRPGWETTSRMRAAQAPLLLENRTSGQEKQYHLQVSAATHWGLLYSWSRVPLSQGRSSPAVQGADAQARCSRVGGLQSGPRPPAAIPLHSSRAQAVCVESAAEGSRERATAPHLAAEAQRGRDQPGRMWGTSCKQDLGKELRAWLKLREAGRPGTLAPTLA
ncbi:uncharacterized protein LOC113589882 [Electrophorus electricus]|uniref:uncharacterized protein LOC113589882 n=1 Tax=Electrophorus electricus TaxID=8005 RepID=UPI0015D02725|nr:uncharacterized protein LOC113589882 [Electrophorus electricus]